MKKPSGIKICFSILTSTVVFLFLTFLFSIQSVIENGLQEYINSLSVLILPKILISLLTGILICLLNTNSLDNIEKAEVGNKQHGGARFMTEKEERENYTFVPDGKEKEPGFVVGRKKNTWVIETTDKTICLNSPPGGGKTKDIFIPTAYYNAKVNKNTGNGASILNIDVKNENYRSTGRIYEKCGYNVLCLDFRQPLNSLKFNLMNGVNQEIDQYKASENKDNRLRHYAKAERYSKQISASIIKNVMGESKDSASDSLIKQLRDL